jgi:hypothetical protein
MSPTFTPSLHGVSQTREAVAKVALTPLHVHPLLHPLSFSQRWEGAAKVANTQLRLHPLLNSLSFSQKRCAAVHARATCQAPDTIAPSPHKPLHVDCTSAEVTAVAVVVAVAVLEVGAPRALQLAVTPIPPDPCFVTH